jgi:hypothetical protein
MQLQIKIFNLLFQTYQVYYHENSYHGRLPMANEDVLNRLRTFRAVKL